MGTGKLDWARQAITAARREGLSQRRSRHGVAVCRCRPGDQGLGRALDGNRAARMLPFEKALKLGFDDFTFPLKSKAHQMDVVDTVRMEVAVEHRTRGGHHRRRSRSRGSRRSRPRGARR